MYSKKIDKIELTILNEYIETRKKYLQEQVDEFLKNKDNSLEDRWEVWTKYSQKNNQTYIHNWDNKEFKGFDNWINDREYLGRGATIDWKDIIESMHGLLNAEDMSEGDLYYDSTMNALMEYLMKENLGSYKWDW